MKKCFDFIIQTFGVLFEGHYTHLWKKKEVERRKNARKSTSKIDFYGAGWELFEKMRKKKDKREVDE